MFIIAHLGYALLIAEIFALIYFYIVYIKIKSDEFDFKDFLQSYRGTKIFSLIPLSIGSLGPDIVDKLISLPLTGYGRYIGHSLLFNVIISGLIFVIFRKKMDIAYSFIFGWQIHLLLDLGGYLPLFYPFVAIPFTPEPINHFELFLQTPSIWLHELLGLVSLLALSLLYHFRGITISSILKQNMRDIFSSHQ